MTGFLLLALKLLVKPPLSLFLLGGSGWLLRRRWPRTGRALVGFALLSGYLLCLPWVAAGLMRSLQGTPPLVLPSLPPGPTAIVVLGADSRTRAPELGHADVGPMTLVRLRYGAALARQSELPLCVTGGLGLPARGEDTGRPPIGRLMAGVLEREYGLLPRWVEESSRNTRENAEHCAALLGADGVEQVFLVSHAWHLPRATAAFERAGLSVVPAPTAYQDWPDSVLRGLVPSGSSLRTSSFAVHEWLGRLWYALHARLG